MSPAYEKYRSFASPSATTDARADLASFLGRDPTDEIEIDSEVRIILVSADFGREITTAVLWLNAFDRLDIRCIKLVPYKPADFVYIDVQQVIPLSEAADYQVQLRKKDSSQARRQRGDNHDFTRYNIIIGGKKLKGSTNAALCAP